EGRGLLDYNSPGDVGGEYGGPIGSVLLLEKFPRRHADHSCRHAFAGESLIDFDAESYLASRAHQDDLRFTVPGIGENIRAAPHPGRGRVPRAVASRAILPAPAPAGGVLLERQRDQHALPT